MTTTSTSRLNATVRASIARATTNAHADLFANTTVASLDAIKQRCADWSDNEYKTATEILYGLLADCLKLYDEHFVNAHDAERKKLRLDLAAALNERRCHRPAHWSQLMIGTMEPPRDRHIEASP